MPGLMPQTIDKAGRRGRWEGPVVSRGKSSMALQVVEIDSTRGCANLGRVALGDGAGVKPAVAAVARLQVTRKGEAMVLAPCACLQTRDGRSGLAGLWRRRLVVVHGRPSRNLEWQISRSNDAFRVGDTATSLSFRSPY